jgi:AraC-like DNA-binding protein
MMNARTSISGADNFHAHHFCSDDVRKRDRLAFVREVYGRTIVKHDIEPHPDSPFHWQSVTRSLPGFGLALTTCSGVHTERTHAQIDSDNIVLNITLAGKRIVRQYGREAVVDAGALAVTRSRDIASCDCDPGSRLMNIRIPASALAPIVTDLDAAMVRLIPATTEPLQLLLQYAEILSTTGALDRAGTRHLVVMHVHDLVALTLVASRDAAEIAKGRGVPAARLHAIKADIAKRLDRRDLTIDAIARLHRVTPRHVRRLFGNEGLTFSEFVLGERLTEAYRILTDPRFIGRPISDIAFTAGFGDLSYFNRTFRRRYGASPSDVREAEKRGRA